jgi:hypothetical protein
MENTIKSNLQLPNKQVGDEKSDKISDQKQAENEFKKMMEELKSEGVNTSQYQLKRLLNTTFVNPYEVLSCTPEASDEELKKQYRSLSMLVHPDKCSDPNASDAFNGKHNH